MRRPHCAIRHDCLARLGACGSTTQLSTPHRRLCKLTAMWPPPGSLALIARFGEMSIKFHSALRPYSSLSACCISEMCTERVPPRPRCSATHRDGTKNPSPTSRASPPYVRSALLPGAFAHLVRSFGRVRLCTNFNLRSAAVLRDGAHAGMSRIFSAAVLEDDSIPTAIQATITPHRSVGKGGCGNAARLRFTCQYRRRWRALGPLAVSVSSQSARQWVCGRLPRILDAIGRTIARLIVWYWSFYYR